MWCNKQLRFSKILLNDNLRQLSNLNYFNVSVNKNNVATVELNCPPVNALNLEALTEFSSILSDIEENQINNMILTSNNKKVFSGGLDFKEMLTPNKQRFMNFFGIFRDVFLKLYGSAFVTVAVINGHSPAGGCVVALACDYRIMVENFTIGLNETQIGLGFPKWITNVLQSTIGERKAELAITSGKLFTTDEALTVGLVDEIAVDKEDAMRKAEAFLNLFKNVSFRARAQEKLKLRANIIEVLKNSGEQEIESFYSSLIQPETQNDLQLYLNSMKNKRGKTE